MNVIPRWWHSRKGMVAVIVVGGYDELARIVVVALFLTANGEKKE